VGIASLRLERQFLTQPAEAAVDVARRVCGLHAQVLSSADLQLWNRVRGHRPGDLDRALWEERSLVKTWLMRGTLHIVPAEDLPIYVAALDNRGEYSASWLRYFGTTATDMEGLLAAVADALDGACLTRAELTAAVEPKVGKSLAQRLSSGWGEFLKPAARRGVLCFGPNRGQNVTFARPDRWIGAWRELGRDEARTDLLRRFLTAYAPATQNDFERWLGSVRRIHEPWTELTDDVLEVEPRRFALRADADREVARPRGVKLLPAFDAYVLFPHSDRPVAEPFLDRVYRKQGWISQTILERGRVVGTWTHEKKRGRLEVALAPFEPLATRTRAAVEEEAKSLAAYLGSELALV
jgi:hypothetical protein